MSEYSMPSYFQSMPVIGKDLSAFHEDNAAEIQAVEQEIHEIREAALEAGKSTEALNESGQWTAMQRIMELVDEGTWCPLNSLYNPQDNKNGSVGIVKGLGRIDGKWAVIIASDNKKLAGAWVPGQADSLLRGSDTAKRLRIPLVYVLNCSGVKLDEQEKVYKEAVEKWIDEGYLIVLGKDEIKTWEDFNANPVVRTEIDEPYYPLSLIHISEPTRPY